MAKTDSSEYVFGICHVWTVSTYIGFVSTFVGCLAIVACLLMGPPWSVLVSTLWTFIPISLIYGICKRKRFFFKPFIFSSKIVSIFGLLVSIILMFFSFTYCWDQYDNSCYFVKFNGPIFALSVFMLSAANVVTQAYRFLNNEKQVKEEV
ncbi:hypothetical protein M3Y97_00976400 [Aphelenchoides bicaudatus]|nr:hypothetical protein M3Y97_00976400 [Aphelenchoides bicaudatus]